MRNNSFCTVHNIIEVGAERAARKSAGISVANRDGPVSFSRDCRANRQTFLIAEFALMEVLSLSLFSLRPSSLPRGVRISHGRSVETWYEIYRADFSARNAQFAFTARLHRNDGIAKDPLSKLFFRRWSKSIESSHDLIERNYSIYILKHKTDTETIKCRHLITLFMKLWK